MGSKALTVERASSVPKPISEGILDLMTVFAAKDEADTDKKRLVRVYVEAIEGFDQSVVAAALRHLKFHNPRNPWRPTPQDVYERCKKTVAAWEREVIAGGGVGDFAPRRRRQMQLARREDRRAGSVGSASGGAMAHRF